MSRRRCKHTSVVWRMDQIRPYATTAEDLLTPPFMVTKRCSACHACLPLGPAVDAGPTVTPEAAAAVAIEIRAAALAAAVTDDVWATFEQLGFTQDERHGWCGDHRMLVEYIDESADEPAVQAGELACRIYRHDGDA